MLEGVDLADIHGQHAFNFQHAAISREDSKRFLDWAFGHYLEIAHPRFVAIGPPARARTGISVP